MRTIYYQSLVNQLDLNDFQGNTTPMYGTSQFWQTQIGLKLFQHQSCSEGFLTKNRFQHYTNIPTHTRILQVPLNVQSGLNHQLPESRQCLKLVVRNTVSQHSLSAVSLKRRFGKNPRICQVAPSFKHWNFYLCHYCTTNIRKSSFSINWGGSVERTHVSSTIRTRTERHK